MSESGPPFYMVELIPATEALLENPKALVLAHVLMRRIRWGDDDRRFQSGKLSNLKQGQCVVGGVRDPGIRGRLSEKEYTGAKARLEELGLFTFNGIPGVGTVATVRSGFRNWRLDDENRPVNENRENANSRAEDRAEVGRSKQKDKPLKSNDVQNPEQGEGRRNGQKSGGGSGRSRASNLDSKKKEGKESKTPPLPPQGGCEGEEAAEHLRQSLIGTGKIAAHKLTVEAWAIILRGCPNFDPTSQAHSDRLMLRVLEVDGKIRVPSSLLPKFMTSAVLDGTAVNGAGDLDPDSHPGLNVFWRMYPAKTDTGKEEALGVWIKDGLEAKRESVLWSLEYWMHSESWEEMDAKFYPRPVDFLKRKKYQDTPEVDFYGIDPNGYWRNMLKEEDEKRHRGKGTSPKEQDQPIVQQKAVDQEKANQRNREQVTVEPQKSEVRAKRPSKNLYWEWKREQERKLAEAIAEEEEFDIPEEYYSKSMESVERTAEDD